MSGLTKVGDIEIKVLTGDGDTLHRWHIDWFGEFWPEEHHIPEEDRPRRRPATFIYGLALLHDGDVVFNLDLLGMVR